MTSLRRSMPMPDVADRIEWPAGAMGGRVLGASARSHGALTRAGLRILASLYGLGVRVRNATYDYDVVHEQRVPIPVISIGNIVAGGAGKTPFARWLAGEIKRRGKRVALIHGGYAADEPALHRQWQSSDFVYEERDRVKAAQQAIADGAEVILLDDAFQHRRLGRDLDIVLVAAETNSWDMLPLGPLREHESALQRADVLVVTRKAASLEDARAFSRRLQQRFGKPVAIAALELTDDGNLPDEAVVVTAIARPDLLATQLAEIGVDVKRVLAYPDHHEYSMPDIEHILGAVGARDIICTEKDAVKLLPLINPARLKIVGQKVHIEEGEDVITAMLERVL